MRSFGCAAVADVESLSARAKALRVFGEADKAQNLFDDSGANGLILQTLAEGVEPGEVFVVFARVVAETRPTEAATSFGAVGDIGSVEATSVNEAEVCVDDWGTVFGELDDARLAFVSLVVESLLEEVRRPSEVVAVSGKRMLVWANVKSDRLNLIEAREVANWPGILAEDWCCGEVVLSEAPQCG